MSDFKFVSLSPDGLQALLGFVGEADMITDEDKVEKLSKDFYWYSPLLKARLEDKRAAVVVRISELSVLKSVVSLCAKESWPVTVRGGGTGNYGQCIPLCGGVVLDLTSMDRIISFDGGVVKAEPGARLGKIEPEARALGYEMRCLPSTWVKSSIAGFLCGGSGGIGSITWGGIANGDNVKSVTMLSIEEEPRLTRYENDALMPCLHAYGTNGIMVEVEMRLAPKVDYQQLIISGPDWDALLDWTDGLARQTEIRKRLVTQFEHPVPTYFRPLRRYLIESEHATFLLIAKEQAGLVVESAVKAGLSCVYSEPLKEPLKPPYITDYTWNHGTLWAIKADPSMTYLQCGYGDNFREQFNLLRNAFPGEIFQHLEWTAWATEVPGKPTPEDVRLGGLPKVVFKSEERLRELITFCEANGISVANPHTCILEEGGRQPNIEEKVARKTEFDPKGLLNPGKMKSFTMNPFFAEASA